jgi:predicted Zn-dependent protease
MTHQGNFHFSSRTSFFAAAMLVAGLFGSADTSFAFGGGGNTGSQTPSCKTGYHWDIKKNRCIRNQHTSDNQLYQSGHDLALAGRYQEALDILGDVKHPDSMTLTMIGYATRKLGDYDGGLAYYQKALTLDPNNVNTHEYLGEAYAEKGKTDLAKVELAKVEAVCGTACEQYVDLASAIEGKPDLD